MGYHGPVDPAYVRAGMFPPGTVVTTLGTFSSQCEYCGSVCDKVRCGSCGAPQRRTPASPPPPPQQGVYRE